MSFNTIEQLFIEDTSNRLDLKRENLCTYGIAPLDHACACIFPDEVVVIGADSGAGKTTLSLHIARHNVRKGKRVALYHLEGNQYEPVQRLKWQDICRIYYQNYKSLCYDMEYKKFLLGEIGPEIATIEAQVYSEYKEQFANKLFIYKKQAGLTLEKFKDSLENFSNLMPIDLLLGMKDVTSAVKASLDIDLIIIDHLQYFSLTNPMNELQEISEILRTCKTISESFNIPIIIISHLRKKGKERYMPGQEDFHGTSNIAKIASTAITLMPDYDNYDHYNLEFPTFIRVAKSRLGVEPNLAMRCIFNGRLRKYEESYLIHKIDSFGVVNEEHMEHAALPQWAKQHIKKEIVNEQ
jgi:hypothetical protein